MKPNASKNRELVAQFPFLAEILRTQIEPLGGKDGLQMDNLTIKVQKADGDLMWRRARNTGLGDNSMFFCLSGKHKNHVGRSGEYVFAISRDNRVINRVNWPRNDNESENYGDVHAWNVLWRNKEKSASGSNVFSDPFGGEVKYMVWVRVETWHSDTHDTNSRKVGARFGELIDRSIEITIYGEPEGGFYKLLNESPLMNHLHLDTRVFTKALFEHNYHIIVIDGRLAELCTLFQDEVFFNGMKDIIDKGGVRGASGQLGYVKILCARMIGYDRVMLEGPDCWVTYQLRPESNTMYVQGMGGTLPSIRQLTKTVVKMWNGDPKNRDAFKPDKKVCVI